MLVTSADGDVVGAVFPHRDTYPLQQHTATIADTTGTFLEEVYVILAGWEDNGRLASFQVYINPLINFIWLGGAVMILGFLVAFWKAPEVGRGAAPVAVSNQAAERQRRGAVDMSRQSRLPVTAGESATPVASPRRPAVLARCPQPRRLALSGLAVAQTPAPLDDEVHDIAKQMNCPTCAGRNLADCPTETCAQWKQEIGAQLQAGKTSQEVLDYFEARFGPTVMQEPPKEGAVLALWVVPVLGALGSGGGRYRGCAASVGAEFGDSVPGFDGAAWNRMPNLPIPMSRNWKSR